MAYAPYNASHGAYDQETEYMWGVCNTPLPYQQERGTQKQIMPPKGWTDIAPIHRSLRLLIITSNHYGNS